MMKKSILQQHTSCDPEHKKADPNNFQLALMLVHLTALLIAC